MGQRDSMFIEIFRKILLAILTVPFSGFVWFAFSSRMRTGYIISGVVLFFIIVIGLVLLEVRQEEGFRESLGEKDKIARSEQRRREEAENLARSAKIQADTIKKDFQSYSEYELQKRALAELTDVMRDELSTITDLNEELQEVTASPQELAVSALKPFTYKRFNYTRFKKVLIERLLRKLCENFEYDPMPDIDSAGHHTYFKATIFEPIDETPGKAVLRRAYFAYPRGMTPRAPEIREETHPKATALEAWRRQDTVVLEDTDNAEWWEDLWQNQRSQYKSMVCYPITKGRPGETGSKVIGILTIDTNREAYFKADNTSKTFLLEILHPFAIAISYIYEMEKLYNLIAKVASEGLLAQPQVATTSTQPQASAGTSPVS